MFHRTLTARILLLSTKKIKRKSSPWMRPEVDMNAGKKATCPVAAICVTIIADLVGSGALEDVVRVVGVAELALMLPYLTSADEIVAQVDVHQQIDLLRHADFADFEIGAAVALTREHPSVGGGETSVVTNALQRPQGMVVRAGPIRSMMEAGVDVVPAPSPPMKYRWQRHGTFA